MQSDVAIRVEGLGKCYRLGHTVDLSRTFRETLYSLPRHVGRLMRRGRGGGGSRDVFWALRDLNFEVKRGEVVGVIGRNGAGKSTLLKILSRITAPTEGMAEIRGRLSSLLEVGTGFHPELTGRENVYLNGAILGMRRVEIDAKFDEIVAFAEVEQFLDTPVKRYSSGMRVRLAFAVAAHLEPECLLVDEVLAVGDAEFQKKCLGKMQDVAGLGRTVLFVSHNMATVQQLCSRGILLEDGHIRLDSEMGKVTRTYLHTNGGQASKRIWSDLSQAPGDDVVRLIAVCVCDDRGQVRREFTVRDQIHIELDYRVLTGGHPLDVYVFLYNEMGTCVLSSLDNLASPWADGDRPVGDHRSICHIPGDFLNCGQFTIHAAISQNLRNPQNRVFEECAVRFDVRDSLDPEGVRGNFTRKWPAAVIRPRLGWSVTMGESRPGAER
jgi:homopolymeric O-antigen transport system ATP-binding protein